MEEGVNPEQRCMTGFNRMARVRLLLQLRVVLGHFRVISAKFFERTISVVDDAGWNTFWEVSENGLVVHISSDVSSSDELCGCSLRFFKRQRPLRLDGTGPGLCNFLREKVVMNCDCFCRRQYFFESSFSRSKRVLPSFTGGGIGCGSWTWGRGEVPLEGLRGLVPLVALGIM